jgi:hypothetical protein
MLQRRPFAYGYSGRLLTSTEANEVFCCDGDDEAPYFIHAMDGTVAGVRNVEGGVLAVDEGGTLVHISVPSGEVTWRVELGVLPKGLAATPDGRWAAVHDGGVIHGRGREREGTVDLPSACAAVFHRDGHTLGVVSETGTLTICELDQRRQSTVEIGSACNSVAWSNLGWWLVAAEDGVHRVEADGSAQLRFLKWKGEPLRSVCASKAGGLCAFVTEDHYVVIFGVVRDLNCGTIIYPERVAYELEFGPDNMLGVGLGMGDGNKIDLSTSGSVARTDPPPDRPRNRWLLQVSHDPEEVGRALNFERAYLAGQIEVVGNEIRATEAPAEPSATEAPRQGDSKLGMWLVLGLVVAIGAAMAWLFG